MKWWVILLTILAAAIVASIIISIIITAVFAIKFISTTFKVVLNKTKHFGDDDEKN